MGKYSFNENNIPGSEKDSWHWVTWWHVASTTVSPVGTVTWTRSLSGCVPSRCLAQSVISSAAGFMPRQPFPASCVFHPALPSLPTLLSCRQTTNHAGWFMLLLAAPSTDRTFMGIPAVTKPQRDSDLGGEFLLFKWASGTVLTWTGDELLTVVCKESFQKTACVFWPESVIGEVQS